MNGAPGTRLYLLGLRHNIAKNASHILSKCIAILVFCELVPPVKESFPNPEALHIFENEDSIFDCPHRFLKGFHLFFK